MPSHPLDNRAKTLLKTLVERYIADGQPVGSRTLSRHSGLDLSPATIRNVMADLEELGLIASPHTSAGRVPTPRGYRLFVDSLLTVQPLEIGQTERIHDHLQAEEPQRVLSAAAGLLSSLSHFAGVVTTPRRSSLFRQVEFIRLADRRVLLILVTPEGDVQNRILAVEREYSPAELTEALRAARDADRTAGIVTKVRESDLTEGGAFWQVGVPEVSSAPSVMRARAAQDLGLAGQRRGV